MLEEENLTTEEAARILRLHVKTVQRWCREGRLPARRVGNQYRLRLDDVRAVDDTLAHSTSQPIAVHASASALDAAPVDKQAVILAIALQKGGVGKTTTTHGIGAALAGFGDEVLMVDMDPQASLTEAIGITPSLLSRSVYDLMEQYIVEDSAPDSAGAMVPIAEHIWLLPSNMSLTMSELTLTNCVRREYVLSEVLAPLQHRFDWILIDCPPSLSILTVNALTCADACIMTVQPEPMATAMIPTFLDTVANIRRKKLNPRLTVAGIVFTRVESHTTLNREVVDGVQGALDGIPILGQVRASVRVREASALHRLLSQYKPAAEALASYRQIAEVLRDAFHH